MKTFTCNTNNSTEKIAEFNSLSRVLAEFKGKDLAIKLGEFRNDRINLANRLYNIESSLYHIVARKEKEFALHKSIAETLDIDFYFANPYHSWERGANENLNGLIRQYIPKKTNFETITDEYVLYVEEELNNRPRKRYNFESPKSMFNLKVAFVT